MAIEKKRREDQPGYGKEIDPEQDRDYAEYEFDPNIGTYEGFSVGDQINVVQEDDERGIFEGEEGQVVGFTVIPPASDRAMAMAFGNNPDGYTAIFVLMDGTDEPIEIKPNMMEVV